MGWFTVRISGTAALGGLLFGFDTAVISGAIPYITAYFSLNDRLLGWAVGCVLIGCALGALCAGRLADVWGRRPVLLICAVLFAVSGLGAGLSGSLPEFVAYRIAGGMGVGMAAMVAPMYIAEVAPAAIRGRLVALYQLAIVTGILLAYCANYAFDGWGEHNWRWMFASQAAPALLFFMLLLTVPETPRWLVMRGHTKAADTVLARTVGRADAVAAARDIVESTRGMVRMPLRELLAYRYRSVLTVGILLAVFQQVTGINAILYYAPVILRETGLDSTGSLLQVMGIGVVNVAAAAMAIALVDRLGRRKLLLVGSALMSAALGGVALCFHLAYFAHCLVLTGMVVYVCAFGCSLGAVTWVYLSEIFPNRIRGLALGTATLALWLADFLVAWTFPMLAAHLGTAGTLLCYAILCVLAFGWMHVRLRETRGRTLEELETLFIESKDNKQYEHG